MKNYKVKITDIIYDTDGYNENDLTLLPQKIITNTEAGSIEDLEEKISNYISDTTGFCHKGFSYSIL